MPYKGKLKIEDDDFDLYADRLILRDNEIVFMFRGSDEYGEFRIEGTAIKSINGFYMTPKLSLIYKQYAGNDEASVKITYVEENEGKKKTGPTRKRMG